MNGKSDPPQYRMNYYPRGLAPAGYAVAMSDKPGLYAASPYAAMPSHYAAGQTAIPPSMQHYAAMQQQYAMVTQSSPYPSGQHPATAYLTSPSTAGYPAGAGVPLSSLQAAQSSAQQSAYLAGGQYPGTIGVQRAMLGHGSPAAPGYGGNPLYTTGSYPGLSAVPGQPSHSPYTAGAPVGFAAAANLPPSASSPPFPGANAFGGPPY